MRTGLMIAALMGAAFMPGPDIGGLIRRKERVPEPQKTEARAKNKAARKARKRSRKS